jgi:hypothetical protein
MDTTKIKKNISMITFDGKYTTIKFQRSFTPDGQQDTVTEEVPFTSDMPRHGDFDKAMDKMRPHLLLRSFAFVEFKDRLSKDIDKKWFDEFLYEDDPRFEDVEIKSVIITTKKDVTGFQIVGTAFSIDDQPVNVKTPPISTLKLTEGYNYPLLDIFKAQIETLLDEAIAFINYKSSNGQLKLAM